MTNEKGDLMASFTYTHPSLYYGMRLAFEVYLSSEFYYKHKYTLYLNDERVGLIPVIIDKEDENSVLSILKFELGDHPKLKDILDILQTELLDYDKLYNQNLGYDFIMQSLYYDVSDGVSKWIIKEFDREESVIDDTFIDNERLYRQGDSKGEILYNIKARKGCCGFHSWESEDPEGHKWFFGFNYGH